MKRYLTLLVVLALLCATALTSCTSDNETENSAERVETSDTAITSVGNKYGDFQDKTITLNSEGDNYLSNYTINFLPRSPQVMSNSNNQGDVEVFLYNNTDDSGMVAVASVVLSPGETATFNSLSGFGNSYVMYVYPITVAGDYTFTVNW